MQQVHSAIAEAEAAERRAAQMLADAQRELARLRGVADQSSGDVAAAADRHNRAVGDNDGRGMEETMMLLNQAENDLAATEARQRELQGIAAAAAAAAADTLRGQEESLRNAALARERQDPARQHWMDTQAEVERQLRLVSEQEAELAQEISRKRLLHSQEKNLVEEEVRLREQRENLEVKEGALRNAHTSFFKAPTQRHQSVPPGQFGY